jgi:hypothetical protein
MTETYVWLATNAAEGALVGDGLLCTSRYCIGYCGIHKGTVWQGRTVGDAFGTSRAQISPSSVTKEFQDSWQAATTRYDPWV